MDDWRSSAVLCGGSPRRSLRLLEIGCGTDSMLGPLGDFGEVVGIEANDALLAAARAAGLDVLNYLDDDVAGLRATPPVLREGGVLVVTVPGYFWLWGGHDVALAHRRRYVAAGLRRLVERAGYWVERLSYFNTVLFPAIASAWLYKRLGRDDRHDLGHPGPWLTAFREWLYALERHVVPRPALPFGTSRFVRARRS